MRWTSDVVVSRAQALARPSCFQQTRQAPHVRLPKAAVPAGDRAGHERFAVADLELNNTHAHTHIHLIVPPPPLHSPLFAVHRMLDCISGRG